MRTSLRPLTLKVGSLLSVVLLTACSASAGTDASDAQVDSPAVAAVAAQSPNAGDIFSPLAPAASPSPLAAAPTAAQAGAPSAQIEVNPAALVYEQNAQSVVNISSTALAETPVGEREVAGVGSGFVIDNQGHIVTNAHVIEDASELNVTFQNGITVPATLVGTDEPNDLAVIKVDPSATVEGGRTLQELLRPVRLGEFSRIRVGEDAIAIGSPLGLRQTVTAGIVSAIRNPLESTARGQIDLLGGAIQTDAAVNPGNSGGPLFNAAGEVIGVNTAILSQSGGNIGIGFAIPINVVRRVVPELIQRGCYPHPYIGVSTLALSRLGQDLKRRLGVPLDQGGLLVQEAMAGAAEAGIRAGEQTVSIEGEQLRIGGDIIVAVDGQRVSGGDLRGYIENNKRPGDTVTLTVLRNGQRQDVTVRLSQRPNEGCP